MATKPTATTRRPRGDGSYSIDQRTGRVIYRDRTSIPGTTIKGRGNTRAEALADARERIAHVRAGRTSGRPESFAEMLAAWLAHRIEPDYPRETHRSYANTARKLIDGLGSVPAHEVRPSDLELVYRSHVAAGASAYTVSALKSVAGAAFSWAVGDGRVAGREPGSQWNPGLTSKLGELPAKRSRTAPDPDAVRTLIAAAERIHHNGALWRAMAECALRPSEAAGLRWTDVDLDAGELTVAGALRWDKRLGEYRWHSGTKIKRASGDAGARTIEIGPELIAALHAQRARGLELQLASRWESDQWARDLIFRKAVDGRGLDSRCIYYHHTQLLKGLDVEPFTVYQLRHYLPTRLAVAGQPPELIAGLLGIDIETARAYYIDPPRVALSYEVIAAVL